MKPVKFRVMVAVLASIFLILTNLLASATAQDPWCFHDAGNYTSNSTYKSNLEALLSSLPTSIDDNGFYNASMGQKPDTAYANVLCRGDVQLPTCRSCIENATVEIVNLCPNYKKAVLWNELCMVRYSNESMFRILETAAPPLNSWFTQNVSNPDQFNEDLRTLLQNLRGQAAFGGSVRKVAAGNRSSLGFQTVFLLVQCTPDLSPEDCSNCLVRAAGTIPTFCDRRRMCRAILPSCNLRYENEPFYNETRLQELQGLITPPLQPPTSSSLPPGPPLAPPDKKGTSNARIIIIIVVSIVMSLSVAVCACILLIKRRKKQPKEEHECVRNIAESLQYDFSKIKAATDDFSDTNKLGQGGFGAVYKGKLPNGQEIAVKRLSMDSRQGHVEFKNEVLLVAKLQHRNLVRLLGFSMEGNERLLIYEYIKNASLDRFIFDPIKRNNLDWGRRYKIIGGISRGLLYLHEESRLKIIHRDLKASNILLDSEMSPKIADFGMARLFAADETQGNTNRIVGTYGYMPPEYVMRGQFSVKSDVFSFGVLILEIVTGQKNNSLQNGEDIEDLLNMAWKHWYQGTIGDLIDPILRASLGSLHEMLRSIHIGLLCVQDNPADRPTMASVVVMFSSFTISLPVPSEPTIISTTESLKNVMSITEFYPR